jgi:hypothetical protein
MTRDLAYFRLNDLDARLPGQSFDLLPAIPVEVEVKGVATRTEPERRLKVTGLGNAFAATAFSTSNERDPEREPAN